MKIGTLVKRHIKRIFAHCDVVEHNEIGLLLDPHYSKRTFGINFPFCIELEHLPPAQSGSSGLAVENIRSTSALESQIPTLLGVQFGPKQGGTLLGFLMLNSA